jgi:molybdopterin/thiamine biosynthesis adenylyltransferase
VLSSALRSDANYEKLSTAKLAAYKPEPVAGWTTTVTAKDADIRINVLITETFPDDPPVVYVAEKGVDLFLKNPHVEETGKVCTISESAAVDASLPEELFRYCVDSAVQILTQDIEKDFLDEFTSYWSRAQDAEKRLFVVVDPVSSLEDMAIAAVCGAKVLIGVSYDSVRAWAEHNGEAVPRLTTSRNCIVVRLPSPLVPAEYPKTIPDIRQLLMKYSTKQCGDLDKHLCESNKYVAVLLVQGTPHGEALAGVLTKGYLLARNSKLSHGFRLGHLPQKLLFLRARGKLRKGFFERASVQRVDHEWIHTRAGVGAELAKFRVCIIGCGSLGSYVAHLLAKVGVGRIALVDPQLMEWENVGRHLLGASAVGAPKAEALKTRIQRELPHLAVESIRQDWRTWVKGFDDPFGDVDLVVSTIADWRCERSLNMLARSLDFPPAIFGWLEPYALAGHALTVVKKGGCLECGMNGVGQFEKRVILLDETTLKKEPGGCAYYQEYGPVRLIPCAGLVAEAAVKALTQTLAASEISTIVGDLEAIHNTGGKVSKAWMKKLSSGFMQQTICEKWTANPSCPLCSP